LAALAVAFSPMLSRAMTSRGRATGILMALLLALATASSASVFARQPRSTTFWDVPKLIDHLVLKYQIKNMYNVGNCRDWNVSKTGFLNESRAYPRDCFVLHDLSKVGREEFDRRIGDADAVIGLDRSKIPVEWFAYGPGLNKSSDFVIQQLRDSDRFEQIGDLPPLNLPPCLIFIGKER